MSTIVWSDKLATGIDVIDAQHKRIVSFINDLNAISAAADRRPFRSLLYELLDYTLSHFTFEESLMDESGFQASVIHKKTHDAFRAKIDLFLKRYENGEDIFDDVHKLLNIWLLDHIADDDNSYVPYVKRHFSLTTRENKTWIEKKLKEIFN